MRKMCIFGSALGEVREGSAWVPLWNKLQAVKEHSVSAYQRAGESDLLKFMNESVYFIDPNYSNGLCEPTSVLQHLNAV